MVSISPKEREREREREKERKREKEIASNRCAETREHEEHFPSSVRDGAVEKKREDSTLEPSKSLGKSNLPKREREREREPAECPTATAYLDRPVREQVILQILQNVTQTHAIATSKTPSLRSQSARVKLVPVQRRALERKGTRGNTF